MSFDPKRLLSVNTGGVLRGVLVGNLRWSSSALHPGEHGGNDFDITVRLMGGSAGGTRQLNR
jgi:tRNA(Glu) U13 pseudouridine synthase TruD